MLSLGVLILRSVNLSLINLGYIFISNFRVIIQLCPVHLLKTATSVFSVNLDIFVTPPLLFIHLHPRPELTCIESEAG